MAKMKRPKVADLLGALHQICPPELAEEWDNVGLQVGDPAADVSKVLVALDAEAPVLDQAEEQTADLVITHHPLIFRPLQRLTPTTPGGRILFRAIQHNIAIASAHTNLDRAADGLNDWLAARLDLQDCEPLENAQAGNYYKLIVYVPQGHEKAVMEALFRAGAGQIGDYDRCSFRSSGTGSFRGAADSQPFIGAAGEFEEAAELRLETIVPAARLEQVVKQMQQAHPYEEVAYDLITLANPVPGAGLGRIGRLPQPMGLARFAELVRERLQTGPLRLVGDRDRQVERVAVCGGSGMALYGQARRQGADCLVTGDIKFHEAQRARAEELALIDAGHFASERLMIIELAQRLSRIAQERHWDIEIIATEVEEDPFTTLD